MNRMSVISQLCLVGTFCLLLPACSSASDTRVEIDFQKKVALFTQGDFFQVFDSDLSSSEREALKFLYAYMPVGDITDYSGEFYLENVRSSMSTRQETTWGKQVPDDVFRHFVLPVRVNDEALDRSRMVFHDELMPRVKDLTMYDAVLEINHWCQEKAIYQPSDVRTSSPLATVKTAYGNLKEESTLLVSALRSVGIPARQVYTQRAHIDGNHVWVEAWVDGNWHFLGACEPEPVLDLGWFNESASRGMLIHSKVFGAYEGPEEVIRTTANYTEVNVIGNYARYDSIVARVTNISGEPLANACVYFGIYNYAEFYPVSVQQTGDDGRVSLSAGLGDMLLLAVKGDVFGVQKVSFGKDKEVEVKLEHRIGDAFSIALDIVPPSSQTSLPSVTPEQRAENDRRLSFGDSIRNAYIASFPSEEEVSNFAAKAGYRVEEVRPWIMKARGNAGEIMAYLEEAASKNMRERALDLLGTLAEKDLRDTEASILNDHLYYTELTADAATVLAPRVWNEMLTPYRSFFQTQIAEEDAARFRASPMDLVNWCKEQLVIRDDLCTVGTTISPEGVWKGRIADRRSRDIFFVSVARSLGVPAWIDRVTGNILYMEGTNVVAVDFEDGSAEQMKQGKLKLVYDRISLSGAPKYFDHFTLSRFDGERFELQDSPDFAPWSKSFKEAVEVPVGYYMLVSGNRLTDGSVLARMSFFSVEEGQEADVDLVVRDNQEAVRVIGNFNSEAIFQDVQGGGETSVLLTTGEGYFVIGILRVGEEPTNHALKDIAMKAKDFEEWGWKIILLFPSREAYEQCMKTSYFELPSTVVFGIDEGGKIEAAIRKEMKLHSDGLFPIFIIADTFNRVVFESHGYTIGIGDLLLNAVHGL